jgi:hypothetical protein
MSRRETACSRTWVETFSKDIGNAKEASSRVRLRFSGPQHDADMLQTGQISADLQIRIDHVVQQTAAAVAVD